MLREIDEQIRKAENAVAGKAAVKRNRFIQPPVPARPSTESWMPKLGRWRG